MKSLLFASALATASLAVCTAASAETLIFGSGNVEQHPIIKRILAPWVERVNAEGGDAIQIDMRHGGC